SPISVSSRRLWEADRSLERTLYADMAKILDDWFARELDRQLRIIPEIEALLGSPNLLILPNGVLPKFEHTDDVVPTKVRRSNSPPKARPQTMMAMLVRAGLPSRIAAMIVITQTRPSFVNGTEMNQWLRSDE